MPACAATTLLYGSLVSFTDCQHLTERLLLPERAGKVRHFSMNLQRMLVESCEQGVETVEKHGADNYRACVAAFALASKFVQSLNE